MKKSALVLWIICVSLWTTAASAQVVTFNKWGADFGTIVVGSIDTLNFPRQFKASVDSLRKQDGIVLDMRQLTVQDLWSGTVWKTLKPALDDYTKPTVLLMRGEIRKDYPLTHWMQERHWSRFEPSGELNQAEAKLRTLSGRLQREGQERMDWLMQQQGKTR